MSWLVSSRTILVTLLAYWRDLQTTPKGEIDAPNVVGGYLFTGPNAGGSDLGYVRFDGRGTVLP